MDNGEVLEAVEAPDAALVLMEVASSAAGAGSDSGSDAGTDSNSGAAFDAGAGSDPLRDLAEECLAVMAEAARDEARAAARKARAAATYADTCRRRLSPSASLHEQSVAEMGMVAEVACALTISEGAASAFLVQSHQLSTELPRTLASLQAGGLSWQHARILCDETTGLGPAGAAALETHFLDPDAANAARACLAGDLTPSRFRARARTWRERHHPVSIETRHTKCVLDRRLEYTPDRDGMAWLSAYLPADQAAAIWEHTTAAARALQGPTEPRTLTQLRADTLASALLGGENTNPGSNSNGNTDGSPLDSGSGALLGGGSDKGANSLANPGERGAAGQVPPPRAQVLVTVPVFSLLGLTDEPATLDGHGPIPAAMARNLVANGAHSFYRVLTDPRDGAPLEIGRTSYRLTTAMRRWLRLRDAKCPFPGCNNHSLDNEADHLLAWADGGNTGISNLGQPCRKHHHLKHNTAWQPTPATKNEPPGWTSPTGRHYKSEHQDWEPPTWPDHSLTERLT
ncbi:HNH endonuclease [Arthrobacter sp. D1-29]